MESQFTQSFKSIPAVVTQLRLLAELSSRYDNSTLPIYDLNIELIRIRLYLLYLKKGWCKRLYFGLRRHGFEFEDNLFFFNSRMDCFTDTIAQLTLSYHKGNYILTFLDK